MTIIGDNYIVKTSSGVINGYLANKVINWDDIPYAQPPINELRWKAPRELDVSQENILLLPKDNNFCVQKPSGLGVRMEMEISLALKTVYILI